MSETKSIYQKLIDARKEFHSRSIVKTGYNTFSKYSYFELSDFLVPAMHIMADNGLIPIVSFGLELASMTVHDLDSDKTIVITSPMSEATLKACQPVQSMGAVETFQRRYLWVALLEIVEHDAIDAESGNPDDTVPEGATDEQVAQIQDFKDAGAIPEVTQAWIDKQSPLTVDAAAGLLKKLNGAK